MTALKTGANQGQEQIPRTASRAPENQGKSKDARDFARDDSCEVFGRSGDNANVLSSGEEFTGTRRLREAQQQQVPLDMFRPLRGLSPRLD
jgi:hypothetical protein